jgi:hypothetical protein
MAGGRSSAAADVIEITVFDGQKGHLSPIL